jgi:hypothetical protein
MSHFIDIDPSRRNLVDEIFYNYSCYDALEFEISCIRKVKDTLRELFLLDIEHSKFRDNFNRENASFLHLMLITKYCQYCNCILEHQDQRLKAGSSQEQRARDSFENTCRL